MQPSLSEEQEVELAQALEIALFFKRGLNDLVFEETPMLSKWKKRLRQANSFPKTVTSIVLPRAVKQICGIKRFMVRTTEAILTHIFCSIRAFTQLELMRAEGIIENWYEVQRSLYLQADRGFILEHLTQKLGLNPQNQSLVNA